MNAIKEIEDIITTVEDEWRDNHGGLTWSGSDVIRIGHHAIADIKMAPTMTVEQRTDAVDSWWEGCFRSGTGAESDICSIAQAAIATSGPWNNQEMQVDPQCVRH